MTMIKLELDIEDVQFIQLGLKDRADTLEDVAESASKDSNEEEANDLREMSKRNRYLAALIETQMLQQVKGS